MSQRLLDNWIATYMRYSQASEAPNHFHLWTAVSVLGGALRRKAWFDMLTFRWYPNFYIVFVAPPGIVSKSTTAAIGMDLLREVPGIAFGPDAVTWQALVQALSNCTETFEYNELHYSMSCLTISASEFGTFLDPHNREMVDIMVELWDSKEGTFKKATKTQGSDQIENPWLNVVACTTPAWIAGNFPEYLIGGGFASRTIFVWGEEKRHLAAYPYRFADPEHKTLRQQLIHDLELISTEITGPYELEPTAEAWGKEWYDKHYEKIMANAAPERFQGYMARKQSHMHKLAMVLAASGSSERVITIPHLQTAEQMLSLIEVSMPKVFQYIGASDGVRLFSEVTAVVHSKGTIERTDLYQLFMHRCTIKEFDEVLMSCQAANQIRLASNSNTIYVHAVYPKEDKIVPVENSAAAK